MQWSSFEHASGMFERTPLQDEILRKVKRRMESAADDVSAGSLELQMMGRRRRIQIQPIFFDLEDVRSAVGKRSNEANSRGYQVPEEIKRTCHGEVDSECERDVYLNITASYLTC